MTVKVKIHVLYIICNVGVYNFGIFVNIISILSIIYLTFTKNMLCVMDFILFFLLTEYNIQKLNRQSKLY